MKYSVHLTAGIIEDINSVQAMWNPCRGSFDNIKDAMLFAKAIQDKRNFCVIYMNGKIHTVLPRL